MQTHKVIGGNDVGLHVAEAGRPDGLPILFIHGFSQCGLTWRRQMDSPLAREFRLVALDIRGHGQSDKPADGYDDSNLWAQDVHAVIDTLGLRGAVLVGWSYGGFIVSDYLRFYGEHDLGGINFVGAATKLSEETASKVLGQDFLALLPGLVSPEATMSIDTLQTFVRMCTQAEPSRDDFYMVLGYNAAVPPAVRQGLFSRSLDNDDVLAELTCPVLITHGEQDCIVQPAVASEHAALIRNARLSMFSEAGHAVFADDADRFNSELASFVRSCAGVAAAS
jgi:non-heme chloroperoxidase